MSNSRPLWEDCPFEVIVGGVKNDGGVKVGEFGFDGVPTILGSKGGNDPLGGWGTKVVSALFTDFGWIPALILTVTGYSGTIFNSVRLYEFKFLLSVTYLKRLSEKFWLCLR